MREILQYNIFRRHPDRKILTVDIRTDIRVCARFSKRKKKNETKCGEKTTQNTHGNN